jgi:hypothetical protein
MKILRPLRITHSGPRFSVDVEFVDTVQHACEVRHEVRRVARSLFIENPSMKPRQEPIYVPFEWNKIPARATVRCIRRYDDLCID